MSCYFTLVELFLSLVEHYSPCWQTTTHSENCSLIPLSVRTACVQLSCQVLSCDPGYMVSPDKTSCVQDPSSVHSEAHEEWEAEEERLLEESDNQVVIRRR